MARIISFGSQGSVPAPPTFWRKACMVLFGAVPILLMIYTPAKYVLSSTSNIKNLQWTPVPPMPDALESHRTAIVQIGTSEFLYVIGGKGSESTSKVYFAQLNSDGSLDDWASTSPINHPTGLQEHSTLVVGDRIYVFGGRGNNLQSAFKSIYCAKPVVTGDIPTWLSIGSMRTGLTLHATVILDNRIFVIGGWDYQTGSVSSVWAADITGNDCSDIGSFQAERSLPHGLAAHSAAAVQLKNGKKFIYVVGGYSNTAHKSVWRAEVVSGALTSPWTPLGDIGPAPSGFLRHVSVISGHYLYVIGGIEANGNRLNNVYRTRIKSDGSLEAWTPLNVFPESVFNHAAAVSEFGRIYVLGGNSNSGTSNKGYFTPFQLNFEKFATSGGPVTYGDTITYTLRLTNQNVRDFDHLTITDTVHTSVSATLQFVNLPSECQVHPNTDDTITCTVSNLDLNETRDLNFGVTIPNPLPVDSSPPASFLALFECDDTQPDAPADLSSCGAMDVAPSITSPSCASGDSSPLCDADLRLEKSSTQDLVIAGQALTYTLLVHNEDSATAEDVVVTDDLPDDVTFERATPPPNSTNPPTWQLGSLPPGESREIELVVQVDPDASDVLTNIASVDSSTPDQNPGNNQTEEQTIVVTQADLRITKVNDPDLAVAGQALTYTLFVSNNGPSTAQDVVVTDDLPDGVTFQWATPSPISSTDPLTWHLGSIPAGGNQKIQLVVQVAPDASGTLTNTAVANSSTPDHVPCNNQAQVQTVIVQQADLAITKIDSSDPITPGETLIYTLVITNYGPSDAQNVSVLDYLPPEVRVVATTPPTTTGSNPLEWSLNVPAGQTREIQIETIVDSNSTGVILNVAIVSSDMDPYPPNDVDEEWTAIGSLADLSIEKSGDPDPVDPGEILNYTLLVTNYGPSIATNVTVTDTLPDGVCSWAPLPLNCHYDPLTPNLVVCDVGTLSAEENEGIQIRGTVCLTSTGTLVNSAEVSSDVPDSIPRNNSVEAITSITPPADLRLTKSHYPNPVVAGKMLTYTITAYNQGPTPAQDVVVSDFLPPGTSFVGANPPATVQDGVVTWYTPTLSSGQSWDFKLVVKVHSNVTGTMTNTALIDSSTPDDDPINNQAQDWVTIHSFADLSIKKTGTPNPVDQGATLTYTLTITNHGPSDAHNIPVQDYVPTALEIIATDPPTVSGSSTLEWNLPTLPAGESTMIEIVATVCLSCTCDIRNVAMVLSDIDYEHENDSDDEVTAINTLADLRLEKSHYPHCPNCPGVAIAGRTLTYTLSVINDGPSIAWNVTVTDTLPSGVTFVAAAPPYTERNDNVITWYTPMLLPGRTWDIELVVEIAPSITGTLINTATVTSSTTDDKPANNYADDPVIVYSLADLRIEKTDDPDPVIPGKTLTYTLVVVNDGPSDARDISVFDFLPPELEFITATQPMTGGLNSPLEWHLDYVAAGQSSQGIQLVATVISTSTWVIHNTAMVSSHSDPDTSNNAVEERTALGTSADLSIEKIDAPDPVIAGETLTYTLRVTNNGPSEAANVIVTDTLPAEVCSLDCLSPNCRRASSAVGSDTIVCDLGIISARETEDIKIQVSISSCITGTIANMATVTSTVLDEHLENNTITETTDIHQVNLGIQKSGTPNTVTNGGTVTYTLRITNSNLFYAPDVTVTDVLPPHVNFITSSVPTKINENGTLTWFSPTLKANGEWTIVITASVDSSATGLLFNTASVMSRAPDRNPLNNYAKIQTMASVPVINRAYVCYDELWCKESVVFNTPIAIYMPIILR